MQNTEMSVLSTETYLGSSLGPGLGYIWDLVGIDWDLDAISFPSLSVRALSFLSSFLLFSSPCSCPPLSVAVAIHVTALMLDLCVDDGFLLPCGLEGGTGREGHPSPLKYTS